MTLPSYKNPPVNEVVCGMQFHASTKLRIPHIGSLWGKFRTNYPLIQHAPPIASVKGGILLDDWRSQFITSNSTEKMELRYPRFAFIEHGVEM
jgi:uncharacterized protein (TIGR04255 family)